MDQSIFSSDFKPDPYWWDRTPRPVPLDASLPEQADVVIVGSGYTGLNAGLVTARAGLSTVIVDAEQPGWGCSSRNGGQVSGEVKPSYKALARLHGPAQAYAIIAEARSALQWVGDFINDEGIDCDYRHCGRFHAAHSAQQYTTQKQEFKSQVKGLERDGHLVDNTQIRSEVDSPFYHGGLVINQHASLDPARYHQGLYERALASGCHVVDNCRVENIVRNADGFNLSTAKGQIRAGKVIVATSGYTGSATPWHQRRIIPIGSYMLATEMLDPDLARSLIPNDRVVSDTRKLVVYYRLSPDGHRILFGARVSHKETDPISSAGPLRLEMLRIFPQLAGAKVTHSWMGFVGYTFDKLPHLGEDKGLFYAMGYCGSGICLSSYFGHRLGQQALGIPDATIPMNGLRFETRPFYHGNPWFLGPTIRYYQIRDRFN